ncbi:MAG TPA: 2-octaprenyl-3-methyl-6-methoxy-1,4-benzoquinol hydroxylase [Thiothrix sp.]|nr:2-octaprenyl-3-methyl-6-methoxy-1,4-benzoquinol hydroxylase [Thiothrix sp.]
MSQQQNSEKYDLVIVGGGMVGSTLACLLAPHHLRMAVIETFIPPDYVVDEPYDLRVSAISAASREVFEQAGVWDGIQARRVSAYENMFVWDATGNGQIHFQAAELGVAQLGHLIENRMIQLALLERLQASDTVDLYAPCRLQQLTIQANPNPNEQMSSIPASAAAPVQIRLEDGTMLSSDLVVGADGAHSFVRQHLNMGWQSEDYGQKGLVTVVETSKAHQATAWQCFMPTGPLAFLPLGDSPFAHRSSIVWSLPADQADAYLHQDEPTFMQTLGTAFQHRLGDITAVSQRAAFPLKGAQAQDYVQPHVALLGDAAHTIHPLAGLGANLGIKDAKQLAEVLIQAKQQQRALGAYSTLRRYERARRGDNLLTMKTMEAFKLVFGNQMMPWQMMRNRGLQWVDQATWLKQRFMRQAMGLGI